MNLGRDYIVWDKSAQIRFSKPGKSDLTAEFIIDDALINNIKSTTDRSGKMEWHIKIPVKDRDQITVAEVDKVLWIKNKKFVKTDSV